MPRDLTDYCIDPTRPYGEHISLTCKAHPNLRWHTKNIDFIGARSIFFAGDVTKPDVPTWEQHECPCPGSDLIVAAPTLLDAS